MGFFDGFNEARDSAGLAAQRAAALKAQQVESQGQAAGGQAFFGGTPQPPPASNPLAALGAKLGIGGPPAPQAPAPGGAPSGGQPQGGASPMGQVDLPTLISRIKSQNPNASPQVMMSALTQALPALNAQGLAQWRQVQAQLAPQKLEQGQERIDLARQAEGGRNTRFEEGQAGQDRRLGVREQGQDRRFDAGESGRDRRFDVGQEGQDRRRGQREDRQDARSYAAQAGLKDRFEKTMQAAHDKLVQAASEKDRAAALSQMRVLQGQYNDAVKNQINADKNMPDADRARLIKDQQGVAEEAKKRLDAEIVRLRGAGASERPPNSDGTAGQAPRVDGAPKDVSRATDQPQPDAPPMDGAKKAPDGKWYIEKDGKYFEVR